MEKTMVVFVMLILTALLWGTSPILEKFGLQNISPLVAVTIRSIAVTVMLLITMIVTGRMKEVFSVEPKTVGIFILSGILAGFLGMWTYFAALKAGATAKVVPIAACYPLVTAFLSVLILRESVTVPRLIGTVFIIAGIWLVK